MTSLTKHLDMFSFPSLLIISLLLCISQQDIAHSRWNLTDEARGYLGVGTPEAQVFNAVGSAGISMAALKDQLGFAGDLGFRQGMQLKWVAIDKSGGEPLVVRKVDSIVDKVLPILENLASGSDGNNYDQKEMQALSKRRMVTVEKWKTFKITKGPKFALERKKAATDLTVEMLAKGTWKNENFKEYNFNALGIKPSGGYLHPLLKVRTQFRKIFTNMGFQEMPTNNYVESSFWNFDALFQPQQHPARDAHDTFFLTSKLKEKLTTPIYSSVFLFHTHSSSVFIVISILTFTFSNIVALFLSSFLQNLLRRLPLQSQLSTSSVLKKPTKRAVLVASAMATIGPLLKQRRICYELTRQPFPPGCSTAWLKTASNQPNTSPSTVYLEMKL